MFFSGLPDTKSGTFNNWKGEDFPQVLKDTSTKKMSLFYLLLKMKIDYCIFSLSILNGWTLEDALKKKLIQSGRSNAS